MIYQILAVILTLAIGIIIGTYVSQRETKMLENLNSSLVATYTGWIQNVSDFNSYIMTHLSFVVSSKDGKIKEPNVQLLIEVIDKFQKELDNMLDIEE